MPALARGNTNDTIKRRIVPNGTDGAIEHICNWVFGVRRIEPISPSFVITSDIL